MGAINCRKVMWQFLRPEDGNVKDLENFRKSSLFSKVPSPTEMINISPKSPDVLTHTCNDSQRQLTRKKW
jgi:hypothetical protein